LPNLERGRGRARVCVCVCVKSALNLKGGHRLATEVVRECHGDVVTNGEEFFFFCRCWSWLYTRETNRNAFRVGRTITLQWTTPAAVHQKAYRLQKRTWTLDNAPKNAFLYSGEWRTMNIIYDNKIAHIQSAHVYIRTYYMYTHAVRVWREVSYMEVRANKSDRNLTDQISGQSFDDHVEQFNSRSPLRSAPFATRFLSLSPSSAVLQSNLWSQLLTVAIVLYTLRPSSVSTRGAKSPA